MLLLRYSYRLHIIAEVNRKRSWNVIQLNVNQRLLSSLNAKQICHSEVTTVRTSRHNQRNMEPGSQTREGKLWWHQVAQSSLP